MLWLVLSSYDGCHYQVLITVCYLLITCRNTQRTSKACRMQQIIPNEANGPSSTIKRDYPLEAN